MVQAIYIVSSSGLVLFSKYLGSGLSQGSDRLLGALLATLSKACEGVTGGSLRLIEFTHCSIYIAAPRDSPVGVVIFLSGGISRDEALDFSLSVSTRLLSSFLDEYGGELDAAIAGAHALGAFRDFGLRLGSILREVKRSQVQAMALLPGVDGCFLIGDDMSIESFFSPAAAPGREMDDVSVVSTVRLLLVTAADLRECDVVTSVPLQHDLALLYHDLALTTEDAGPYATCIHHTRTFPVNPLCACTPYTSAVAATSGDTLACVSLLTDEVSDSRVLAWRFEGAVLLVHGRRNLEEVTITRAPRMPFQVLQRLCATTVRYLRSGGSGASGVPGGAGGLGGGDLLGLGRGYGGGSGVTLGGADGDIL